jgi:two-component system, cell cycle sensor histidine kinase and response regulator CckA
MADSFRKPPFFSGRRAVGVVMLLGAAASILIYFEGRRGEHERAAGEFRRLALERQAATREMLVRYEDALAGLWTMFTVEENVSRAEFARATRRIEDRTAHVQAFEWVPFAPGANRADLERMIGQSHGGRPVTFTELNANQQLVPAAERLEYYPVSYVQPLEGNERALGYDLKTGPTRPYLENARRTHRMVATGLVKLVQEKEGKLSVILIWPAYRARLTPAAGENATGPETFLGFVQAILDVRAVLEQTRPSANNLLDVLFVDGSAPDPALRVLHYLPSDPATERSGAPAPRETDFDRGPAQMYPIALGGRDWQVFYRPRAGWIEEKLTAAPALGATLTLLVAGLFAGLVDRLGRRTDEVEKLVAERTAQLHESHRQLASLLRALPGMAFRCRPGEPLGVLYASEGTLALTGHPPEDFIEGRVHFRNFIHPDDLPRLRAATQNALQTKKDLEIEYRVRARDGSEKWVFSRGRGVYDAKGALDFFEGLVIETTAQKKSEAERIAIERKLLEGQKLESLGLLAGGIAHDFNNLLTGVLGNASLLRLALPPSDATEPQLRAIETASLRAAELCRQMLAYAGKGRFVIEPTALSALVEGMLPLLKISIGRGVRVHLELTGELPFVMADATQLRQIVMNLVINASDAIGNRSGDIFLTTGLASLKEPVLRSPAAEGELPPGDYVFLEVRDTGCGMAPETLQKIFDPFFSTKFAGRGLGLAAVRGIVRSHEGALRVESTPGAGSTFRLLLPPAKEEPAVASPTPTGHPWSHTARVLVIEDDETVRTVAADALKSYGLSTQLAADGETGIAAFRKNPAGFDLVLLDLIMPGLSGEETLAHLRSIRRDVTVLIMSGYNETDTLARLEDPLSRLGFLHKPFTREMLKVKVRALLA